MTIRTSPTLRVERVRTGGVDVIALPDPLGSAQVVEFREALLDALGPDTPRLAVDLGRCVEVNACVLGMLADAARMRRCWGGELTVLCADPDLRRLLEVTTLDRLLAVRASIHESAAARAAAA